jgi:phosphocarrier protein HPr
MIEREVIVGHRLGLHARAAARVVQLSSQYQSAISLLRDDKGTKVEADARSILSILLLAAAQGSALVVRADGTDEGAAVDCICEYIKG